MSAERTKKVILHIEVPGIDVEDCTQERLTDCSVDPHRPDEVADFLFDGGVALADGVVTIAHDDVGGYRLCGYDCRIVGAQVVALGATEAGEPT